MKNWRPPDKKDWARQRSKFFEAHCPLSVYHKTRELDYEAGADAVLEALLSLYIKNDISFLPSLFEMLKLDKAIMSIPDEEAKE